MNVCMKTVGCAVVFAVLSSSCSSPSEGSSGGETASVGEVREALLAPLPVFDSCTADRQEILKSALATARVQAARAYAALQNATSADRAASTWYATWFGAYDANRYATVTANFQKISNALSTGTYTFKCNACTGIPIASSDVLNPYHVNLCDAYWKFPAPAVGNRPLTGIDGQSGVLVHETSHFQVVAGTVDHAAHCTGLTDPNVRVTDPDCYEFFSDKALGTGFMIMSDNGSGLALNAWGGAHQGGPLKLSAACNANNPDCTWTYRNGMIVSDRDPSLAINANGAGERAALVLSNTCRPAEPNCTWTFKKGMLVSDQDPSKAMNPWGGAQDGRDLVVTGACRDNNPDCTWTTHNMMITSDFVPMLAVNALNGAQEQGTVGVHIGCTPGNPDCTWTYTHGMLQSERNRTLMINAWGGAQLGQFIKVTGLCNGGNTDCTWTMHKGLIQSDTNTTLNLTTFGGDHSTGFMALTNRCPECTYAADTINAP